MAADQSAEGIARSGDNTEGRKRVIAGLNSSSCLAQQGETTQASRELMSAWDLSRELGCEGVWQESRLAAAVSHNCATLAERLMDCGEDACARRLVEWQVGIYPSDFLALYNLGRLAARRRDHTSAIGHYRAALDASPRNPSLTPERLTICTMALAGVLYQSGEQQEAVRCLEEALTTPGLPPAAAQRVKAMAESCRDGTAVILSSSDDVQRAGVSAERLVLEANRLDEDGHFAEACHLYDRALQLDPGRAETYYDYAVACSGQEEPALTDKAIALYEKALELKPSHAAANANLGALHTRKRMYQKSLPLLNRALELGEDSPLLRFYVGLCHMHAERWQEALTSMHAALGMNPDTQLRDEISRGLELARARADVRGAQRAARGREIQTGHSIVVEKSEEQEREKDGMAPIGSPRTRGKADKSGAPDIPSDTPLQVVSADTLRELGRELAEAMGKAFVRTSYMSIEGDRATVHFECDDGCYVGEASDDTVEIYEDPGGSDKGRLLHTIKRT